MEFKTIMIKRAALLLMIMLGTACHKGEMSATCPIRACTDVFVTLGVTFKDNLGNPIAIDDLQVLNLRTHLKLTRAVTGIFWVLGYYPIVDDSDLNQLSTDGDDVQVSATNPLTKQTIITIFKIAGGCNCHVVKITGPNEVLFN